MAVREGYISEIGVYMGLNTIPYEATLVIGVNGHQVFANVYKGLKQRSSDWATVFPVTGSNAHVKHGDTITITIAPYAARHLCPIDEGQSRLALPAYGPHAKMVMRCFINGTTSPVK